jgi:hypothetical protein
MMVTKTLTFTYSYDPELLVSKTADIDAVLGFDKGRVGELTDLHVDEMKRQSEAGETTFNSLAYSVKLLEEHPFTGNELLFLIHTGLNAKIKMKMVLGDQARRTILGGLLGGLPLDD